MKSCRLLQVTTEAGNPKWSISNLPQSDFTPTNKIQSGVTYGVVPPASQEFIDVVPLAAGETYLVVLHVTDTQGDGTLVGHVTFTVPAQ